MTETTPAPEGSFSFDKCDDAAACKASMARLLAPHMDWTVNQSAIWTPISVLSV